MCHTVAVIHSFLTNHYVKENNSKSVGYTEHAGGVMHINNSEEIQEGKIITREGREAMLCKAHVLPEEEWIIKGRNCLKCIRLFSHLTLCVQRLLIGHFKD